MNRRRSRNTLLIGLLLFCSGQVTFNAAVRANVLPLCDPVFVEKFELLEKHRDFFTTRQVATPQRVLLLGSSRSQLGFNAQRFAENSPTPTVAFNFSTPGAGPLTNLLYLRRLLAVGVSPDVLLIEIHPGLMTTATREMRWLSGFRFRPGEPEMLKTLGFSANLTDHLGWRGWLSATHSYRLPALSRYAVRWLPCPYGLTVGGGHDAFGWVRGRELPSDSRGVRVQMALGEWAEAFQGDPFDGPPWRVLDEMVRICREQSIRPMLFVSAESQEFRAAYPPGTIERLRAKLRTYDLPVLDLNSALADELTADGHHPTPRGSQVFTDRLGQEVTRHEDRP